MIYPGSAKLPEGMTVDRAAKIMLLALCTAFEDIANDGESREEQALEAARAAAVACGFLCAIREAVDDPKVSDGDMLSIAKMLDEFEDWLREMSRM